MINTDCIGICKSNYHNGHVVNGKFAKMKKRNKIKRYLDRFSSYYRKTQYCSDNVVVFSFSFYYYVDGAGVVL